jgi:hypothetical protein
MAKDDDVPPARATGDELVLKINDLGRRGVRNRESFFGPPPTPPLAPAKTRSRSFDEEVGLDRPVRGGLATPRAISEGTRLFADTSARDVAPTRDVRRTRSLSRRRS